ncbi:hypothetical protein HPO96_31965 [Kribbella sandramycini]|uniref:Uncharacterized protein n=1 Tax=Kribbella sandramycini TaxID=60450 RepID=A0A7Y4L5X0_9ACTN|nr:hypothetical protein [Kribbella sandramycini]MBB6567161.1 hypothetical protein [Kribbella sandramycini]NOL44878.1 hypothetical protein [Kribbella sandramycini]
MSGHGYDLLASRPVETPDLRSFLRDTFAVPEADLFVAPADRVDAELRDVPPDLVFATFCTYEPVEGHFAISLTVGVDHDRARPIGHADFALRFATRFQAMVLYSDDEPPGLWSVVLPDGTRLLATLDETDDRFTLTTASVAIPDLPEVAPL